MNLINRSFNYDKQGTTDPGSAYWNPILVGFRKYQSTGLIGHGDEFWHTASEAVLNWEVKSRSGFQVVDKTVAVGHRTWIKFGPVREPVEVVAVINDNDRCGFAYGTLEGHPVSGEEAFIVHRDSDEVYFTQRSITRASTGIWRVGYPFIRLTQQYFRFRYARALRGE